MIVVAVAIASLLVASAADAAKLDLLQAVELGRGHDDSLQIADKSVEESRLQQRGALASLLPQVSASASFTESRDRVFAFSDREVSESLSVTQTLWNTQQKALYSTAKKRLEIARIEQAKATAANLLNVTEAYLDLLSANSRLRLATRRVAGVEAHKEKVEALFAIRESTILEITETLADLDLAMVSVIVADNNLANRHDRLIQLIGDGEHEPVPVTASAAVIDGEIDPPLRAWLDDAERGNYDLRIARLQLEIAAINIKQAKQDYLPRVSLRGSFDRDLSESLGNGESSRQAILSVDLPLYQGGRRIAKLREAQVAFDRQRLRIDQQAKQLKQQVTALYRMRQAARARVRALRSLVVSNRRKLTATQNGFAQGDRTSNEVLTAQNLLIESENDLIEIIHDYIFSHLQLKNAVGDLLLEDIERSNELYFSSASN